MATLKELKGIFITSISELYPLEEIQSFFYLLTKKYLGLSRIEVTLNYEKKVSDEQFFKFEEAIQRLIKFEPIQYIIGEEEFYGLPFLVNKDVLIPRPETEELVNWIVSDNKGLNNSLSVLDIGTGSGCIAISLAYNLPKAVINALDVSKSALKVAKQNSKLNNVTINFQQIDVLNCNKLTETYDVVVSNPPYVREKEKLEIESNVLKHEPATALFVRDNDPLLFYRKIAELCKVYLKPRGLIYFEINEYLSEELIIMLKSKGFNDIVLRKDIFGKDRMLKCRKNDKTC